MGLVEQTIVRQCINTGREIPDKIQNAPKLIMGLEFVLDAFFELDTERQLGFSPGPIPRSAIKNYANEYDMYGNEFDEFLFLIRRMDTSHLVQLQKKQAKK